MVFGMVALNKKEVVQMTTLVNWIKHHQVAAFFIIAFGISWPLFLLIFFIFPGNEIVKLNGLLAVFSPALAAMLVSAIVEPRPKSGSSRPRWIAFGLAWLASWLIMALYYWYVEKMKPVVAIILWGIFALFPAWILSSAFAVTPGIRKHFTTLLRPRGNPLWYLLALLAVPVCQLLGAGITRLLGGVVGTGAFQYRLAWLSPGQAAAYLALTFLSGFLCSGGINEESGWRGFALPRLQARYPVIVAVGVVCFFWSLWHIPYDIGLGTPVEWMVLNRTLHMSIFSVLFAWVYNRTKGSILAPALFHPSMNTFGNHFPLTAASTVLLAALAVFAIVYDRMWQKLPAGALAVYAAPEADDQPVGEAAPIPAH